MDGGDGGGGVVAGDDEADATFGGALGDGDDVDVVLAEGAKEAAGDAGGALHTGTDSGDDGDRFVGGDAVDVAAGDFGGEDSFEGGDDGGAIGLGEGEADRLFRGGLADEQDAGILLGDGTEGAGGDTGDTHHTTATNSD